MPPVTLKALKARLKYDQAHAERTLVADGYVAPMAAVTGADGRTTPILGDNASAEAKARSADIIRLIAIAEDASVVTFRTESWLAPASLAPGISPSQSDARSEVVIVTVAGRIGEEVRRLSSVREIVRGQDGKSTGLKPVAIPGADEMDLSGPMTNLLPPKRPNADERALARALLARMQGSWSPV